MYNDASHIQIQFILHPSYRSTSSVPFKPATLFVLELVRHNESRITFHLEKKRYKKKHTNLNLKSTQYFISTVSSHPSVLGAHRYLDYMLLTDTVSCVALTAAEMCGLVSFRNWQIQESLSCCLLILTLNIFSLFI